MTSAGYSTVLSTPTASVIPASSINRHWQQPQPMGPSPLAMPMQRHPHIDRITEWVTPPHPEMIHPIVPALPVSYLILFQRHILFYLKKTSKQKQKSIFSLVLVRMIFNRSSR